MITVPTTLILGAGASKPYGFPTGNELRHKIITRFQNGNAIEMYERAFDLSSVIIQEFERDFRQSGDPSIDVFLERRPKLVQIGKTAIAESLIPFENVDSLFNEDEQPLHNKGWYNYLLDAMTERTHNNFSNNQLKILTFNYDRSLEWYLSKALKSRYGFESLQEGYELVKTIPIIHLYGTLGGLPWMKDSRAYEPSLGISDIIKARDEIRIISDGGEFLSKRKPVYSSQDASQTSWDTFIAFEEAHNYLMKSKRIIFLGFGYNSTNLSRLRLEELSNEIDFFGTAYGMTVKEMEHAQKQIGHAVEFGENDWGILRFLREKITLD
jgi:hypothetical protein